MPSPFHKLFLDELRKGMVCKKSFNMPVAAFLKHNIEGVMRYCRLNRNIMISCRGRLALAWVL